MKRVTLREDRAPYLVDEEILSNEPVIVERNGQAVAAVIPMADYEAFLAWRATLDEPWPGEPPRTPEGDLEALAAVERIRTMFSDTPPEMWTEIIENPLYDFSEKRCFLTISLGLRSTLVSERASS